MTSDPNSPDNEPDATRISTPRGASGGADDDASDGSTRFIPALHFRMGQMILARYRLKKPLGRGGFGVVWRATDENLHIDVAIKFLAPEIVHNPEAIEDLKQETRYSLRLTHPNIVRIHGFFQEPELAGILMEYVDGGTLQALKVERPGRFFEATEVGAWIPALCDALDYAHAKAKVVHRDLKPGNIMLDSSGDVKIADFGISSSISDTHSRLSLASGGKATSGTPVYMSPQHLMGTRPSVADDIYSFGATLYDLLAGKPPFYTGDIPEQVRLLAPPSLAERRRELGVEGAPIPRVWEETIAACLAKNPGDRPSSAGHVAAMLGFGSRSATAGSAAASRDADPLADQADLFATRPARSDVSGTGAPSSASAAGASSASSASSMPSADSGGAGAHARSSEGGLAESQAGAPSATDRGRSTDRSGERTPRPGAEVVERPGPREIARAAQRDVVRAEPPRSRIASRIPIAICAVVVIAVAVLGAMKIFGGREGSGGDGDRAATTAGRTAGSAASGDVAAGAGSAGERAPIGSTSGGVADPSAAGGTASDAPPPTAPDAAETPGSAAALDDARAANDARAAELRTSIVARMRAQEWAAAARESEALLALAPNDREASQWLEISRSRARAEERASGSRTSAAGSADRSAAAGSDAPAGSARASGEQPPAPSTRATESEPPAPPPTPARAQQSAPAPSPEDGVRTMLARYESALEALDAAAYASLWQSMDGDERRKIERSFQQFSAQSVELAVSAIEIDASRATARFSEKRKLTPVVGSPLTQERNVSMKLERDADGAWRIVSMN